MKNFALSIILLLGVNISFAQIINLRITNLVEKKAALASLSGEKISFIDSVSCNNKKEFEFNLEKKHPGVYQLTFNNKAWVDFIYDKENIEIETEANHILDSLKIIKSETNKIYYEFIRLNKLYKTKSELLQLVLARYPEKDDYYRATAEKLNQLQDNYLYFVDVTSQTNPGSFIARYVRTTQLPVVDISISTEEQPEYLKTHALDNVDFNDDGLIYSDAFTSKTIEYLTYYRNPRLPKELLESEFEKAIDSILIKAKVNDIVYTHIIEYLLDGFKKFGFDNVINYIVENYVIKDDLCLGEKLGNTLERRIEQARFFKPGVIVPNIILPDTASNMISLNEIDADSVLIVFYASWCPHCQTLLPKLYNLYKSYKGNGFKVMAVSIDTSRINWMNFIRTNHYDWINVSELKGWDGESTLNYCIYATPTMFLINNNKKLVKVIKQINELTK